MKLLLLFAGCGLLAAQQRTTVPFVGCASDGQVDPIDAPVGKDVRVALAVSEAQKLAYYRSPQSIGVLAPRGWHCFSVYGSGSTTLFVSPTPIEWKRLSLADPTGPGIEAAWCYGDTSGRSCVAKTIARVFPAYTPFVTGVIRDFEYPPEWFPSGPYPADSLRYKDRRTVEYRTAAGREGLGTDAWLKSGDQPVDGVAILVGPDSAPDLLQLSVRLPAPLSGLTKHIAAQFERDSARAVQR
jgi:hypothetical protein